MSSGFGNYGGGSAWTGGGAGYNSALANNSYSPSYYGGNPFSSGSYTSADPYGGWASPLSNPWASTAASWLSLASPSSPYSGWGTSTAASVDPWRLDNTSYQDQSSSQSSGDQGAYDPWANIAWPSSSGGGYQDPGVGDAARLNDAFQQTPYQAVSGLDYLWPGQAVPSQEVQDRGAFDPAAFATPAPSYSGKHSWDYYPWGAPDNPADIWADAGKQATEEYTRQVGQEPRQDDPQFQQMQQASFNDRWRAIYGEAYAPPSAPASAPASAPSSDDYSRAFTEGSYPSSSFGERFGPTAATGVSAGGALPIPDDVRAQLREEYLKGFGWATPREDEIEEWVNGAFAQRYGNWSAPDADASRAFGEQYMRQSQSPPWQPGNSTQYAPPSPDFDQRYPETVGPFPTQEPGASFDQRFGSWPTQITVNPNQGRDDVTKAMMGGGWFQDAEAEQLQNYLREQQAMQARLEQPYSEYQND